VGSAASSHPSRTGEHDTKRRSSGARYQAPHERGAEDGIVVFLTAVHGIGRAHLMEAAFTTAQEEIHQSLSPWMRWRDLKLFGTNRENCWRGGLLLTSNYFWQVQKLEF